MARNALHEKLIDYLQDTHAMEENVLRMLDNIVSTTDDPELKRLYQQHRDVTSEQELRLRKRLESLGQMGSITAETTARVTAWLKSFADMMRTDRPGKNLRDAWVTEHVEIAAYELLERLARRAGDPDTVRICQQSKGEEYEMARRLGGYWDRVIDLTLLQAGIEVDNTGTQTGSFGSRADAAERGKTWGGEESYEADMGIGVHGNRDVPKTQYDAVEDRIPPTADLASGAGLGGVGEGSGQQGPPRNPAEEPRTIGEANQQSDEAKKPNVSGM